MLHFNNFTVGYDYTKHFSFVTLNNNTVPKAMSELQYK